MSAAPIPSESALGLRLAELGVPLCDVCGMPTSGRPVPACKSVAHWRKYHDGGVAQLTDNIQRLCTENLDFRDQVSALMQQRKKLTLALRWCATASSAFLPAGSQRREFLRRGVKKLLERAKVEGWT